jgi:hypothetical protein
MPSRDEKSEVRGGGLEAPARPAQPAQPAGRSARRRRRASAGLAVLQGAPGGGGTLLAVRRDFPEILLPDGAAGPSHIAGASDVLAAWQQAVSAAQFGAAPRIIAGVALGYRIGLNTAAGAAGVSFVSREARVELGLGAPAAPPALIGRHKVSGAVAVSVTNPGASTVCSAIATPVVQARYAPVQVPANSVLSVRAAFNDALGNTNMTPVVIAYDPAAYNLVDVGLDVDQLLHGLLAVQEEHTDYATVVSGGGWANGAWVTATFGGAPTADADYLVRGVTLENVAPAGSSTTSTATSRRSPAA